jgi:hypothetical protein
MRPVPELANSLQRLDFYYECVKREIENLLLGEESPEMTAVCLEDLALELEDIVNDVRGLAHRLKKMSE